jgi:outer membrane protein assembly factor BamD
MPSRPTQLLLLLCIALLLSACASRRGNTIQNLGPQGLYDRGHQELTAGNYAGAIKAFKQLEARFPFSNSTRQAQLDLIYAYYKSHQTDEAIDAADEFERENPTHPRVDYCIYMKGLAYFDQAPNILERLFNIDVDKRPPKDTRKAFSAFQELIRRFPDSRYAKDARERMIFLRNRLATYENYVAGYYMRRGAYVAAANRAKYALEHYPGAPQLKQSLTIMIDAYEKLGMADLASDAQRVYDKTFGPEATTAQTQ